jgi:trehalose synthase-fused probable maltokinase
VPPDHLRAAVAALGPDELGQKRWFGGKGSEIEAPELVGAAGPYGDEWLLALRVGGETYSAPASLREGSIAEAEGPLWIALACACLEGAAVEGDGLALHGDAGPAPAVPIARRVRPLGIDQSNTSVVLDERLVLKCYRRLAPGVHPEIELTRYLAGRGLTCVPPVRGSATINLRGRSAGAVLLQDYVADGRDGWLAAEAELRALLDAGDEAAAARAPQAWAPGVGRATAEVHAVLATAGDGDPAFAPRRARPVEAAALAAAARAELDEALELVPDDVREELAAAAPALRDRFETFTTCEPPLLTRVHGDLHIGQFLRRGDGEPALVDFEGEPTKSTTERRRHSSPLRDVAGVLRSVDHAAHWVCSDRGEETGPVAEAWIAAARSEIRAAYDAQLEELGAPLAVDDALLAAFEAEKAAYEFVYAVRFLPSWLVVPRRALASALA